MAQPVKLWPAKGGNPVLIAAPSEVQLMLKSGEWVLEEPKPKPAAKKPKGTAGKGA